MLIGEREEKEARWAIAMARRVALQEGFSTREQTLMVAMLLMLAKLTDRADDVATLFVSGEEDENT